MLWPKVSAGGALLLSVQVPLASQPLSRKLKSISLHLCKLANVGVTSAENNPDLTGTHAWCAFIKSWRGPERIFEEPVTLVVFPKPAAVLSLLPPFRSSLLHFYTVFEVTCQQQFD